jgi:anti-sigma factor ChrR (cupin superfamily)
VWRKRLDLAGPAEAGRVTSVVRYDAGSRFHEHPHPDGEEILVLDGIFSDEHGDYPAGTFLLNPEGFVHAPFSREGCVLLVKLRQYPGRDRHHVVVDTRTAPWLDTPVVGITYQQLYGEPGHPERIVHVTMAPGSKSVVHEHPAGEEVFVLEGECRDEFGSYDSGDWVRYPAGSRHQFASEAGCRLYVKTGHLGHA